MLYEKYKEISDQFHEWQRQTAKGDNIVLQNLTLTPERKLSSNQYGYTKYLSHSFRLDSVKRIDFRILIDVKKAKQIPDSLSDLEINKRYNNFGEQFCHNNIAFVLAHCEVICHRKIRHLKIENDTPEKIIAIWCLDTPYWKYNIKKVGLGRIIKYEEATKKPYYETDMAELEKLNYDWNIIVKKIKE